MDTRPEGVYVTKVPVYDTTLFNIERVNGNQTVSSVEITKDEARNLIFQLASLGVHE